MVLEQIPQKHDGEGNGRAHAAERQERGGRAFRQRSGNSRFSCHRATGQTRNHANQANGNPARSVAGLFAGRGSTRQGNR